MNPLSKILRKWFRIIHRDLGYFFVGVTIVYAVSGIILNHKKPHRDPAFKTRNIEHNVGKNLTKGQVLDVWEKQEPQLPLNKIHLSEAGYKLYFKGGIGEYNRTEGVIWAETYTKRPLVFSINKLHYNRAKRWVVFSDFYAAGLIFFALSGLVIIKGKNGFKRRGVWFVTGGIVIIALFLIL